VAAVYDGVAARRARVCTQLVEMRDACTASGVTAGAEADEAWRDRARLHIQLFLGLCALEGDAAGFELVRLNLFSSVLSVRDDALELLDELLPGPSGRRFASVLPFWLEEDTAPVGPSRRLLQPPHASDWPVTLSPHNHEVRLSLARVPLFADVECFYRELLAGLVQEVVLAPERTLFHEGDEGDALYVVTEGTLSVRVGAADVAVLGPGECVGDLALLDGRPRSATLVAREPCRLYRMDAGRFRELLGTLPPMARALLRVLDGRIRRMHPGDGDLSKPASAPATAAAPQSRGPTDDGLGATLSTAALLRRVALFSALPTRHAVALARIARTVPVAAGDTVFREGDAGHALYLVRTGSLSVSMGSTLVAKLGPADCVGEMSLVGGLPRSATVTALEDGELVSISARDFHGLLATEPGILMALLTQMASRLRELLEGPTRAERAFDPGR
jgi:CRP-like cAMP-binding protein